MYRILLVQTILKRTMVSGMTDDIIFQKWQRWVKRCDHIMTWYISMPYEHGSLVKHSVESGRSVVTNDDAETTFLLNVLYRIDAREFVFCPPKNKTHYLTLSITYVVWFGTVNALAQDRRTVYRFANIRKAVVYQLRKSEMSFQKQKLPSASDLSDLK